MKGGNTVSTATKSTEATPKLVCKITGKERATNIKYLESKATRVGISVDELVSNYVSREALKLLRQGNSVESVRSTLGVSNMPAIDSKTAERLVRFNGKHKQQ
ncbi:MAG: hypothetical protein EBU90_28860 [Proteobacteria bacterium]|nr:hypothetical protein [Pseudomonadota bacterium]